VIAQLSRNILRVRNLDRSIGFYSERLGMVVSGDGSLVGFGGATGIEFRRGGGEGVFGAEVDDGYWKIGITLADVDVARSRLMSAGVEVSEARQFLDIGYLCHLSDPDGYVIELLQHRFAENHVPIEPDEDFPLGQAATLGQVTLRVRDADASLGFYRDRLGMTLLSRQDVPDHRFTLYFLAGTAEIPPDPDVDAVGNREWLWQRPYTTLELQHRWEAPEHYQTGVDAGGGFWGLALTADVETTEELRDPDGYRVLLLPRDAV
jgi:catechol 2,3-dioxygenase-like lactoylglutathione lyase family enzyme